MRNTGTERAGGPRRGKQGFASMDPQRVRQIAAQGGNSVPSEKRPFARDRQLAAEAGRKGGQRSHPRRHGVSA